MSLRIGIRPGDLPAARVAAIVARLGEHELVAVERPRDALRAGDIDVAADELANLPVVPVPGIELVAMAKRGDARDAYCSVGPALNDLPATARVGAVSARARAQLRAARTDLTVVPIDEPLDSVLAALGTDGTVDALVVPVAQLTALGRADAATEVFDIAAWPTTPGQGVLALEVAASAAPAVRRRIARLDHRATRLAAEAERGVLSGLGRGHGVEPGTDASVAAVAMLEDGLLFLTATVYAVDGSASVTASHAAYPEDTATPATELSSRVAEELLSLGAGDLLADPADAAEG